MDDVSNVVEREAANAETTGQIADHSAAEEASGDRRKTCLPAQRKAAPKVG
ncbi:MAG: hypothetical protein AAGG09_12120 [Pseudomonadota bacterium]